MFEKATPSAVVRLRAEQAKAAAAAESKSSAAVSPTLASKLYVPEWFGALALTFDEEEERRADDADHSHSLRAYSAHAVTSGTESTEGGAGGTGGGADVERRWFAVDGRDADQSAVMRGERASPWHYSGRCVHTVRAHSSAITCLHASDGERPFLTGARDGVVKLWHVERHAPLVSYLEHSTALNGAFFVGGLAGSRGGNAVASVDTTLHVWEAERAHRVYTYAHEQAFVASAVCDRMGGGGVAASSCVALAAADNSVVLVDVMRHRAAAVWSVPADLGVVRTIAASSCASSASSDWYVLYIFYF